jgi:SAM-dependent methyltransferase
LNPVEYERMFEAEDAQWWYAGMRSISFALLDAALTDPRERLFLDAGCGTGGNLQYLARRGRAVGVDLSEQALRLSRQRGSKVARASVAALPFADGVFDGVTSFDVLYHRWVSDDAAAVRELARVLKPGGLLLVRVPALKMLWGAHDEAVYSRHRYTRRELIALLRAAGLEVLRCTYGNSILFPALAMRRGLDRLTGRQGSDVQFLPRPLEWTFRHALELEARLVRHFSLPIGTSVFGLGRRPTGRPGL